MTTSTFEPKTIVDNDAVLAIDIRMPPDATEPIERAFAHALLIGIEDGTGVVEVTTTDATRFVPIARGRVEWLGDGKLAARQGHGAFGRALLVEVRNLPVPEGVVRTFGDRTLLKRDDVCVYEEFIGPGQCRRMHNHGPRLVTCITDLHTRNTLPGDEKLDVKRPSGTVVWNPKPVTHEITNAGDVPFWCVLVEHP
jgi:hypothetical protein